MPFSILTPRINNNDDTVRLSKLLVAIGTLVRPGDLLLEVETDKASYTVEAEKEGYLLAVNAQEGDTVDVGSVIAWIGTTPHEIVPTQKGIVTNQVTSAEPSLKARMLLAQYGLKSSQILSSVDKLTAADVEHHIRTHGMEPLRNSAHFARAKTSTSPSTPGRTVPLTPEQHGMLRTVQWHSQEAVPAFLEVSYDPASWKRYAADFQKANRLMIDPLVSLKAWRLVEIAKQRPEINATLVGDQKHIYDHVNFGFTVQVGEKLYVVVVRKAESLTAIEFVKRLGELQRAAMKDILRPDETSGATIVFSSMARWNVTRHIPILVPQTALIVAHTTAGPTTACIGATYDHRLLNGWDVVRTLADWSKPEGN